MNVVKLVKRKEEGKGGRRGRLRRGGNNRSSLDDYSQYTLLIDHYKST